MQQRKDEILAKKAKLAELKRQRELRQKEFSQRASGEGPSELASPTPTRFDSRAALDKLVETLVDGRAGSYGSRDSRGASPAARASRPSSVVSSGQIVQSGYETSPGAESKAAPVYTTSVATQTFSTTESSRNNEVAPPRNPEIITYSIGVQTTEPWVSPKRHGVSSELPEPEAEEVSSPDLNATSTRRHSRKSRETEDEIRQTLRLEIEEELKAVRDSGKDGPADLTEPRFPTRALTGDEMNTVVASEEFLDFVERSSKVIERALDQDYDVLADYERDGIRGMEEDEDEGYASSKGTRGRRIREVAQFYDERWSKRRMISDIGFSPKFPELLLAAYTKNPAAPQDPSGLVQVWNLHLHSRPEYTFHSSSDVLTAKFSPFHPSLIVGGSYSGQVLLWDTRSRSAYPIQKTPLTGASAGGHTHPIYCVDMVGTQNANNIISCSTDGVVCGWSVDMLSQPQEYLELMTPPPSKSEDVSPTCMAFPPSDPTSFLVGTEEGSIYSCHRYDRAGAKAGVDTKLRYKGHTAPVMSLNFHSARGPVDLSDIVLTSSLDWTIRLWRTRPASSTTAITTTSTVSSALPSSTPPAHDVSPVLELSREDVVYDARWSPQRAGVIALVDGAGAVEVWDLLHDTEVPAVRAMPEPNRKTAGLSASSLVPKSLNKVAWDDKEGKRLAVGGAGGLTTIFEVERELAGEGGKAEEWAAFKKLVGRLERSGR